MTRAVLIQRSPSERRPGPMKPRSPGQKRATRIWIQECPALYQRWRNGLTPLPKGWSAKGGVLTAAPHLWGVGGRLKPPTPVFGPFLPFPYGPFVFESLIFTNMVSRKQIESGQIARIKLEGRSWQTGRLDEADPEWAAIRSWLSDLSNLRKPNGKPCRFKIEKQPGQAFIWITNAAIAMRFFETFVIPA